MIRFLCPELVHLKTLIFWSNYSDLTRPGPPNGGLVREIPLISGKSRLVKYYNLARILSLVFLFGCWMVLLFVSESFWLAVLIL